MGRQYTYNCTRCLQKTPRDELTVKRVQFVEMGEGGGTQKSRVLDWLCPSCLSQDPEFQREPFKPMRELVHG